MNLKKKSAIFYNKNGNLINEKSIKLNHAKIHEMVVNYNKNFNKIQWSCMVFNYINNINIPPKCYCGNNLKFIASTVGYKKYCSIKCAVNSVEFKEKKEKTLIVKYGVKNPSQSELIKNKKKITFIENYGVDHPMKSKNVIEKMKLNLLDVYGVENVSQIESVIKKKKATFIENYGVDHHFKTDSFKEYLIKYNQEKYNVNYYVESTKNKNRIRENTKNRMIEMCGNTLNIDPKNIEYEKGIFKISNYCSKHNSFKINRYNFYNRTKIFLFENICTKCNKISNSSKKEIELKNFISSLDAQFTPNDRTVLNGLEIDIYLPDYKLGIEFNGIFYHSTYYNKDQNYHLNKTNLAESEDVQLLHVFEDEWLYKKNIIKSIIKSKLGVFYRKINPYECNVDIHNSNNDVIKKFLNDNNIHGFIDGEIYLKMCYKNEIIALMVYNKTNNNDEYNLLRFCNKINTKIINGFEWMLSFFIENFNPKAIITEVDRRFFQGKTYIGSGFKLISVKKPDYCLIKLGSSIRENKSEDIDNTKNKTYRIYDSGKLLFKLLI